jgi:accessory colonization factor AcfC
MPFVVSADGRAQDTLRVYGSEGPAPAFEQAARVFGIQHDVYVDLTTGPPEDWLTSAEADADLVFASAAFMMTDFLRIPELQIDEASVTTLYIRPAALLVRPGNPKHIVDFPDLLKPNVRVMVVSGSGQTGLWEDMAGRQGDIRTIRAFRGNIAVYARTSTEAVSLWTQRPDLDAYVTWNIWHKPLRNSAELIQVSEDYRIYRHCDVAMTKRGLEEPAARRFLEFLSSERGAEIFASWGWMPLSPNTSPLVVTKDIAFVCEVRTDEWKDGVGRALSEIRDLVHAYRSRGTPPSELHVTAVLHGDCGYWALRSDRFAAFTRREGTNPNEAILHDLMGLGVSVELCRGTMAEHGWTEDDVLTGVKIVPNAYARIVDLELQGHAHLVF